MKRSKESSPQWIFYLTIASLFGVALLRTLVVYWRTPEAIQILGLLAVWMILFILETILSIKNFHYRFFRGHFWVYLVLQIPLTFLLLARPDYTDYLAILFTILSMQVMQNFYPRPGALWIGFFSVLILLALIEPYGPSQAIALALVFTALNIFLASYSLTYRRTLAARQQNKTLVVELEAKSQQLKAYARQLEQLAVEKERHRLARELHDSVTQTIFSMTLTTQSAIILLDRDFAEVEAQPAVEAQSAVAKQLDRLYQLTQSTLSEMQVLISELRPSLTPETQPGSTSNQDNSLESGLGEALRKHLASRQLPETLTVKLEIEGNVPLKPKEEQGLFRIIQEAVNNIIKHSQASQATIILHMKDPTWVEIRDWGQGFDVQMAFNDVASGKVGLKSMHERAVEIGWDLQIASSPVSGTRIRIEKITTQTLLP